MPSFSHDNVQFNYLDRGTGLPIVFQHGLGGDVEKIFSLLETPPGFRLLGMDSRAHGKTAPLGDPQKLRFDTLADDLTALLDHLQLRQAIVGGTSMGAGVALNCALRYPERVLGLVLLRPAWLDRPTARNAQLFDHVVELMARHGPQAGGERFKKSPLYTELLEESSDAANSVLGLFTDPRALETLPRLRQLPHDAPNRQRAQWRQISMPTLVLANRRDPIHPFEYGRELAGEIPGARLVELPPKCLDPTAYTTSLRAALMNFLQSQFPSVTQSSPSLC